MNEVDSDPPGEASLSCPLVNPFALRILPGGGEMRRIYSFESVQYS